MIGRSEITLAAAIEPQRICLSDWKVAIVIGMVTILLPARTRTNKNSFQTRMNVTTALATSPGLAIGKITCHRVRKNPAPSKLADSSKARGMAFMIRYIIRVESGT